MRRRIQFGLLAVTAALILSISASQNIDPLPDRYAKWLNEEVVDIMTSLEKDVFLKLKSERERDFFIEAFWKHRDPTSGTPENEFKTEHYRRLAYADKYFGHETSKPGRMTDRGRMYIILGEPNEIRRILGKTNVYDCEVWFYQNKDAMGLPPGFNLLFFQERGRGEYKLYSPVQDGPQALMPESFGSAAPADSVAAYRSLQAIDPMLAEVSLSLIPGEQSGAEGRPSLVSETLVQRIESAPQRMVEETYARKFVQYKDIVDVEYTANYMDSDVLVRVIEDPSGLHLVHYAIEPKRLSVDAHDGKYFATLKLTGAVATLAGRLVYQFDKTTAITMDETEMKERSGSPFEIYDVFPLVSGDYRFSVLLKNESSKEFTSFEQNLSIPSENPALRMTSPILAYGVSRADLTNKKTKPFLMGPYQIHCQPEPVFLQKETLFAAFQLLGLSEDLRLKGELRFRFFNNGKLFKEIARMMIEYQEGPNIIESVRLADFPPAHYRLRISYLAGGAESVSAEDEFDVTPVAVLPRPWVSLRVLPETGNAYYDRIAGIQLFNLGRVDESRRSLEMAFRKEPTEGAAAELGRIYMSLKAYDKVEPLLAYYLNQAQPADYEIYALAGKALQALGHYDRAIEIYNRALSNYGVNTGLLNAIGESELGLGKPDLALAAWERSLSLNANQPEIKKNAERIRSQQEH